MINVRIRRGDGRSCRPAIGDYASIRRRSRVGKGQSLLAALAVSVALVGTSGRAYAQTFAGGSLGYSEFSDLASFDVTATGNPTGSDGVGSVVSMRRNQTKNDAGLKVFAGVWLSPRFGVEAGYANLGSSSETIATTGVATSATWQAKVSASAIYAAIDLFAGVHSVGETVWTTKLGAYSSKVRSDSSLSTSSRYVSQTQTTSGVGPYFATGFERRISANLSGRLDIELFYNVKNKFNQRNAANSPISSVLLTTLSLVEIF